MHWHGGLSNDKRSPLQGIAAPTQGHEAERPHLAALFVRLRCKMASEIAQVREQ